MANLLATFRMVDEMSNKFDNIANSGTNAVTQWERAGQLADTAFGRASSGATRTAQSVDSVSSSLNQFQSAASGATASTDYWTDAIGNYDREAMQAIYSTEELVEMGFMSEEALNAQASAADEAAEHIDDYGETSEDAADQSEDFGSRSVDAVQELSKALMAAGIVKLLEDIYDAFMDCSDAAAQFEIGTAKVATLADTTQMSMGLMSSSIRDMSNETGKAAVGLSDAVYQAISAGVNTAQSVEFAGTANKLAAGGFTEAATAVDVLTTAINAYSLESADATRISDMLITTQNLGKTTVNELATNVGKVIPLAAAYGVEMDNLSTGYAIMTANGIATAESSTYLKAMLNELGNSSSQVSKTMQEETGLSFAMLMEQGYSLGDVLDVLGDSVDYDTTKFNELWGSTEAGIGALSLFNSGSEKFNSVLGEMQTSAGATAKAYATMAGTTAHSQERMQTAATNLKIVIGDQLNPVLTQLYDVGASAFIWIGDFLEDNPAVTAALTGLAVGIGVIAIAATGFALVTSPIVVTAITAITTAMMANHIFLIITGVVALTAAVVAFVSIMASQKSEYDTWTASTKKQYDELQSLNDEYDNACEQYGETSEEALRLRYEMDDLNAAFEANKQTVEEFVAECEALVDAHNKLISSYQDSLTEINNAEVGTLALIQKLGDLATATDQSTVAEEQMRAIIAQLNKQLPDLALSYDDVTSSVDSTVEALKKAATAQADQNRFQKSQESYVALLEDQARLENEIAKAEENLNLERQKIQQDGYYTEDSLWASWTTDIDDYRGALETLEAAQSENAATLAEIEKQWEDVAKAAEEAENVTVSYEDAVKNALGSVQAEMDELIVKYDESYEAARSNIDGVIGLFDTMKTETEVSISGMITAMESQVSYLETYTENLQKAAQYGLDDGLIASLSDGSEESAGYLDAIIGKIEELGGSTEGLSDSALGFVESFNGSFENVSAAKDQFAATVADMETGFTTALDEMEQKLNTSIDNMNMETEAAAAAKDTISAYIASIKSQQDDAVSAAQAVANAVSSALSTTASVKVNVSTPSGRGYASGTLDAAPGIAMVGEEGPELINFAGGEVVYTADETERIISGANTSNYRTSVPNDFAQQEEQTAQGDSSEKKITLEIAGSGALEVSGNADEGAILDILMSNVKPVLLSIIRREVFEEGDMAYEF